MFQIETQVTWLSWYIMMENVVSLSEGIAGFVMS